jgi:hypothetical protein
MRFDVNPELALFAGSVRGALTGWEPDREPVFGEWRDEHDGALAQRLAELGWVDRWVEPELLAACVAGGIELGRARAPQSLVDGPTLGGSLCVDGRARHVGADARVAVVASAGISLARAELLEREATADGTGTVRVDPGRGEPAPDGIERLRAWSAASHGYLAGLSAVAVERTVAHVSSREQFGAPLAALPGVQARLADAALAAEGIELVAWDAGRRGVATTWPRDTLAWAARATCDVTAVAHQAHGAVGFALESGLHRLSLRSASALAWIDAVLAASV